MKFVGRKAVVEGNGAFLSSLGVGGGGFSWAVLGSGGRERRRISSNGRARRIVKDFTINWPPKRRPFTSDVGLNEKSDVGFVDWSFGCLCFCFLFFFFSFSSMVLVELVVVEKMVEGFCLFGK